MTIYYVDSASGSNTSPYDTWAKAATALSSIVPLIGIGDVVYVASTHSETGLSGGFTFGANVKILCADKTSGAPPTLLATGASLAWTGTAGAAQGYFYGITFSSSSVSLTAGFNFAYFENCLFKLTAGSGTNSLIFSSATIRNCTFNLAAAGQFINFAGSSRLVGGGGVLGVSPTLLFYAIGGDNYVENIDLSNLSSAFNLIQLQTGGSVRFRRLKLPASWTGVFVTFFGAGVQYGELIDCDSGATNYVYHRAVASGDIYDELTIINSGGASDGTTPLSWKAVSNASAGYSPFTALSSGSITIWNDTAGSVKTLTLDFVHDNVTGLTNGDIWMEVNYPADSADTLGGVVSSGLVNVLATPTTYSSSGASWTTTGMSNPNAQKMSVTFTPKMKGPLQVNFFLNKASYTVYVDPKVTLQ